MLMNKEVLKEFYKGSCNFEVFANKVDIILINHKIALAPFYSTRGQFSLKRVCGH